MMDDKFVERAVDRYIGELAEERVNDFRYHPSSMFLCDRATILAVRGVDVTSPADTKTHRLFRSGHMLHGLIQDALPGHPGVAAFYPEFAIDVESLNIAGHGDGLIFLVDGDAWVLEVKSTGSLKYGAKAEHMKQGETYAVAVRDFGYSVEKPGRFMDEGDQPALGPMVAGMVLVYINRLNLEMKSYVYPYSPAWRTMVEKKVAELDKYRLNPDTIPVPLPEKHWFRRYCTFRGSGQCCDDTGLSEW